MTDEIHNAVPGTQQLGLKDAQLGPWTWARSRAWLLGTVGIAFLGALAVLYLTRQGAGASGDSAHYLMGAENLLAGKGYARTTGDGGADPITGFPPVFSSALALIGLTGFDLAESARWLNALLFAANLVLIGVLVYRSTRSAWPTLGAVLAVGLTSQIIELHGWIMSEGLYILFSLLGMLALLRYLEHNRLRWVAISAVTIGLAALTRYAGLSLLLTGLLVVLLLGRSPLRTRVGHAAMFGLLSAAPVGLWFVRNAAVAGTAVNRQVAFHPVRPELWDQYLSAVTDWVFAKRILPYRPRVLLAGLVGLLGPMLSLVHDLKRNRSARRLDHILMIYLPAYVLTLMVNSYFLDAATTASAPDRYMAPAYVAAVLLVVLSYRRLLQIHLERRGVVRLAVVLSGILLVLIHATRSWEAFSVEGLDLGYVGLRISDPELVHALGRLDSSDSIISNNPELVYVLSARAAYIIPIQYDPYKQAVRQDFDQQIRATENRLADGAKVVIFGMPDEREQEVLRMLSLERFDTFESAAILGNAAATED